jgi:hypothetical protein
MTAFLLAMAYRSWVLTGHDEVQDDVEDRRIMARAERDEGPDAADRGGPEEADEGPDPDSEPLPTGAPPARRVGR